MKLTELNIIRYGPLEDRKLLFTDGINLVYGPNESGKTLSVDALIKLLLGTRQIQQWDIDRVPAMPNGYVVVTLDNDHVELRGERSLLDIIDSRDATLTVDDLRNIFVIRDSDLATDSSGQYLETVADRISGTRTADIGKIIDGLRKEGHITPTGQLSDLKDDGKLKSRVKDARRLIQDINEYLQTPGVGEYDKVEQQSVRIRMRLKHVTERFERLQQLKEIHEAARLRDTIKSVERLLGEKTKHDMQRIQNLLSRVDRLREKQEIRSAMRGTTSQLLGLSLLFAIFAFASLLLSTLFDPLAMVGLPVFGVLSLAVAGTILYLKRQEARAKAEAQHLIQEARSLGITAESTDMLYSELEQLVKRAEELRSDLDRQWSLLADRSGLPITASIVDNLPTIRMRVEGMLRNHSDLDPKEYDERELDLVAREKNDLEEQISQLNKQLAQHHKKLQEFEIRASRLFGEDFEEGELRISSIEGLQRVKNEIEKLLDAIEVRAETARQAIRIMETIKKQERKSIADLFEAEGTATEFFAKITNGAYRRVQVDGEEPSIVVHRDDGTVIPLEKLSRGASDQLYLSVRFALARRVLGDTLGFFVMDDPFIASDSERLRRQVKILGELAEEGWQIVYFTSKDEIVRSFKKLLGVAPIRLRSLVT